MGWSGAINSWAWKKQAAIIKNKQKLQIEKIIRNQENFKYLEELKKWKSPRSKSNKLKIKKITTPTSTL